MQPQATIEQRQRRTMRLLRDYVDKLPVTTVTARALRTLPAANLPDELESLAAKDPMLAVRMLYLSNHKFHSLHHGIISLGSLLSHVGASEIAQGLPSTVTPSITECTVLWDHSVHVATVAAHLSQKLRGSKTSSAEAYLAGLVHDLGRFIMMVAAPEKSGDVSDREWRTGEELLAAEQEICGFDHTTLGWLASRAWNFPDSIAAVCRRHHEWADIEDDAHPALTRDLIRIVGLADDIAFSWEEYKDLNAVEQVLRSGETTWSRLSHAPIHLGSSAELQDLLL